MSPPMLSRAGARPRQKHDELLSAYQAYLDDHGRQRSRVVGKARDFGYHKARRPSPAVIGPAGATSRQPVAGADHVATQFAREAAEAAGESFDRKNPLLSLNQWAQTRERKACS
jgi:hypothetical protein